MGIEELLLDMAKHEGLEEGINKGKIEGKLEGRHEEALQIAREMKNDKFPVEQIMKLTKLSLQEIKAL